MSNFICGETGGKVDKRQLLSYDIASGTINDYGQDVLTIPAELASDPNFFIDSSMGNSGYAQLNGELYFVSGMIRIY